MLFSSFQYKNKTWLPGLWIIMLLGLMSCGSPVLSVQSAIEDIVNYNYSLTGFQKPTCRIKIMQTYLMPPDTLSYQVQREMDVLGLFSAIYDDPIQDADYELQINRYIQPPDYEILTLDITLIRLCDHFKVVDRLPFYSGTIENARIQNIGLLGYYSQMSQEDAMEYKSKLQILFDSFWDSCLTQEQMDGGKSTGPKESQKSQESI